MTTEYINSFSFPPFSSSAFIADKRAISRALMHPKPVFPPVMTTTLLFFLFSFALVALLASRMDDDDIIGRTNRSRRLLCRTFSKALERSLENEKTDGTFWWERNEARGILVSLFNACNTVYLVLDKARNL